MLQTLEEMMALVTKTVEAMAVLSEQMTAQNAAILAHRHLLGSALAKISRDEVGAVMEDLHKSIDRAEHSAGASTASYYREELDMVQAELRYARQLQK